MGNLLLQLIASRSGKSSGRALNVLVGVALVLFIGYDTVSNGRLSVELATVLAAYGVTGFGISKGLDPKEKVDETNSIT